MLVYVSQLDMSLGSTTGVKDGVKEIVGVGVVIGLGLFTGKGMNLAATTPIKIPKRIRARPVKKIRAKPEWLDDEGATWDGSDVG